MDKPQATHIVLEIVAMLDTILQILMDGIVALPLVHHIVIVHQVVEVVHHHLVEAGVEVVE